MRKYAELPVEEYLYRYITNAFQLENNYLKISNKLILPNVTNGRDWKKFYLKGGNLKKVKILMEDPNPRRVYKLYRFFYSHFRENMCVTAEQNFSLGFPARYQVDIFLSHYNIPEEMFKRESAYKIWQRYMKKKEQKQETKWNYHTRGAVQAVSVNCV